RGAADRARRRPRPAHGPHDQARGAATGASRRGCRRQLRSRGVHLFLPAVSFAAVCLISSSPLIAAVLLIEATALGGARQKIILVPGLMAAGIGSLASIGIGSLTRLGQQDH